MGVRPGDRRGLADLLVLISIVLFVASSALAVGVFLYSGYLQSSAASKVDQLERAKAAFEPALINELTRLDDRMRTASELLNKHLSPSAFFQTLEQGTIKTIAFNSLDLNASNIEDITINMAGVAASVNAIAVQADLFSKSGALTSPIFSNINRQIDGVHFNLSAILDSPSVNYVRLVGAAAAAIPTEGESPFGPPPLEGEQQPTQQTPSEAPGSEVGL